QGFGRAHTINPASPTDVHDDGAVAQQGEEPDAEDPTGTQADGEGTEAADPATAAQSAETSAAEGENAEGPAVMRTPDGTREVLVAGDSMLFFTQGGEAYLSHTTPAQPGATATLSTPAILDPFSE